MPEPIPHRSALARLKRMIAEAQRRIFAPDPAPTALKPDKPKPTPGSTGPRPGY